ncbi:MAG: hypothetical protein ACRCXB_28415 [Aeromonadaceae bacterium]
MAVNIIPIRAVPSQTVQITLAGQPVTLYLRQLGGRQYISVSWAGTVLCETVLMVNRSAIIRAAYTGFVGDIAVYDTQGDDAPEYTGWGSRWLLLFNDAD